MNDHTPSPTQLQLTFEEWRDIPDFEGWYQASSHGNIRRIRKARNSYIGRVLKLTTVKVGYQYVQLSKNNIRGRYPVHGLVCSAFHGPRPKGLVVNHKDGNRSNNCPDNLEWLTYSENQRHGYVVLGRQKMWAEKHPNCRLSKGDIVEMQTLHALGQHSRKELAERFGVHQSHVSRILTGKVRKQG